MSKHEKKRRRWLVPVILVSVVAVLIGGAAAVLLHTLGLADIIPYRKADTYGGGDMLTDDLPAIDEGNTTEAAALPTMPPLEDDEKDKVPEVVEPEEPLAEGNTIQQLMRSWCANGEPVSSKSVYNLLLIGIDNEGVQINGRADSLMLFSANEQTGTVTLASLLRDQYAYIRAGGKESFEKMHLANVRGGPELLIATIEAHYKVQIDNYIMVSLDTFPPIIDRLGGVTVTLTEAEAEKLGGGLTAGDQWLDGKTALRFARIRSIDSEQARTGRQRRVLSSLMNKLRGASFSDLMGIINDVMPLVRTGLSKGQMVSLATRAVADGWQKYAIKQLYTPAGTCWRGRMVDDLWYWMVDYPVAARDLQLALYGKSNITLGENRVSFLRHRLR